MNQTTSILNQKLTIPENTIPQEVNGEIVMINFESESYYTLDTVGTKFWQLFTESENVETVIQHLVQIYTVDEAALRRDLTKFVEELVEEELLSCDSEIEKQIQQHQQSISKNNSEKQDNRLPYEPPTLRKHGKFNNTTKSIFFAPDIDGLIDFTDFS